MTSVGARTRARRTRSTAFFQGRSLAAAWVLLFGFRRAEVCI